MNVESHSSIDGIVHAGSLVPAASPFAGDLRHDAAPRRWTIVPAERAIAYFAAAIVMTFALVALVAAANLYIDPFAMYRLRDVPGVNMSKPAIYHRVRLFKAFEARRIRP